MKSLVIFDSNYGNTQLIANTIAKQLKSRTVYIDDFSIQDLEGVELLIVGSPINAWGPTPKIKELLDSLKPGELNGFKVASFDTRVKLFIHGDAAKKISQKLEKAGGKVVAPPQGFIVEGGEGPLKEGEVDKAIKWANSMTTL